MPAIVSYVVAREGEASPNNVVAYDCLPSYVTPIPPANNNIRLWATGGDPVLPAASNVKSGVGYGGGHGTELVGTYSPGAGGNTYQRGTSVNA